jgi:hypothetical protein
MLQWGRPMTKYKTRVCQASDGPLMGRWKIYINEQYCGSAGDKFTAKRLAKDWAKEREAKASHKPEMQTTDKP